MIKTWYEIWADDGLEVPYLLLVLPEHGSEVVVVLDPKEGGRIAHRANDYEAARLYKVLAARYRTALPSEALLIAEMEHTRRMLEHRSPASAKPNEEP
jgi:hypothetical protein